MSVKETADWYVRTGNVERGPISSEALKHLVIEGRVTPETPIKKGASGNWVPASRVRGLFASPTDPTVPQPISASVPPLVPTVRPTPQPGVVQPAPQQQAAVSPSKAEEPSQVRRPAMDTYHKALLGVGAACLAMLAVSPFLTWINILGGGMLGIEGHGKIILVLCLGVAAGLVIELVINKRSVASVFLAQALGTVACLWMVGEVWRVRAIRESPEIGGNIFGPMLATQVTPGVGLILGMLGGIGMAIAFALVVMQCLGKTRIYAFTQALSLLLGLGIAAMLVKQGVPSTGGLGSLLPAVAAAGDAACRATSMNQIKCISLAMHMYHDAHGRFPPAYKVNKDGKPLLSWRVLILPYMEEGKLYDQFHHDEPWDSEHNKKLIARMPKDYKSPSSKLSGDGKTNYLTVRNERSVFPGKKGIGISEITDGMSSTIMTLEVSDDKAVIWTKPDDFEYDEKDPLKGLIGLWSNGFIAGFADGWVRFLPSSLDSKTLEAFFTRNGGEIVDSEYPDSP